MNTDSSNYVLHKEFQDNYKLEHPSRECRIQNLLGIYTTVHANNAFDEFCLKKSVDVASEEPHNTSTPTKQRLYHDYLHSYFFHELTSFRTDCP